MGVDAAGAGDSLHIWRRSLGNIQGVVGAVGVRRNKCGIREAVPPQPGEQAVEQADVRAGAHWQMEVGNLGGCGAARVDDDQLELRTALLFVHNALEQDRMAPGHIRPGEHDQVRQCQILITSGDQVGAERPTVSRYRGRHAQPGVGIDIGAADEAFHQLVGDVVVLRQELARNVERHCVRTVALYDVSEVLRDPCEGVVPARPLAIDLRIQEALFEADRVGQRRAFRAQAAKVRGMLRIARDLDGATVGSAPSQNPAANPAIGTGRADRGRHAVACSGPNSNRSRIAPMSWPADMSSKYHEPWLASP